MNSFTVSEVRDTCGAQTAIQSGAKFPAPLDLEARVALVLSRLPLDAPWFQPKHIAPLLGITDNAFTKYCRQSRHLHAWRGSYRFMSDDREHMAILRKLIVTVLWSGQKLPDELRARPRGLHPAPRRLQ